MTIPRQASFPPPGHTLPKMRRTRISYYELFVCNSLVTLHIKIIPDLSLK